MNELKDIKIIFGKENAQTIGERITLLELDTFFQPGLKEPVTAYAVVEATDIPMNEIAVMQNHVELHNTMMKEYRKKNWSYVEQAVEHLIGKWNGRVDSFYEILSKRIIKLKDSELSDDWDGVVDITNSSEANF
jgi:hypothetical protein